MSRAAWQVSAALILIAAGFAVWMYVCDWWALNRAGSWLPGGPPWPPKALFIYRVFGAFVASWLVCGMGWWLAGASRRERVLFAAWLLPMALLFIVAWPGYMLTDSVSAIRFGLIYPIDLWLGFFQPFFYATILQIVPHPAAILLVQLLLVAGILAHVSETLWTSSGKAWIVALWSIIVITSPALMSNFALLTRDILFCLGVTWLALFVFRAANDHEAGLIECLFASVVAALVVAMRGDGWLVVIPFILGVVVTLRARRALVIAIGMLPVIAAYAIVMPSILGDHKDDFNYKVANTLNPVGYVLQSRFHTDQGGNVPSLARVLDVEKIVKLQNPYEIPAWWSGGVVRESAEEQDRRSYLKNVAGLLRENLGIFLAGRVETLAGATGMAAEGFRFADAYTVGWPLTWVPPASVNLDLAGGRLFPAFSHAVWGMFIATTIYHPTGLSGSVLWWNFLPWLAILLFAPYVRTTLRGLAWLVAIACLRVPLVFLGAPAAQFKYYLPVYFLGAFALTILAAHLHDVIRSRKVPQVHG